MDCPHCHTPLPDDAKFCGVCGGAVLAASNAGCPSLGPNSCLPAAETACSPPPAHSVRQLFLILFSIGYFRVFNMYLLWVSRGAIL